MRDVDGTATGLLLETAMEIVRDFVPNPTGEQLADMMAEAQALALKSGITMIHDFDEPSCLVALQILRERGDLGLRVVKQINQRWLDAALASGIRGNFGDDWIRIGALKLFADGALGPKTALMFDPYESEPDNYGMTLVDKEEMVEYVSRASQCGLPSSVHAIGDKAVHDVLDVFESVRREEAARGEPVSSRRHRIEHVQIIHPQDVARLAELDVIASMQPIHATSDMAMADRYWGARSQYAYNPRLQLDQGARIAFGSDAPWSPLIHSWAFTLLSPANEMDCRLEAGTLKRRLACTRRSLVSLKVPPMPPAWKTDSASSAKATWLILSFLTATYMVSNRTRSSS